MGGGGCVRREGGEGNGNGKAAVQSVRAAEAKGGPDWLSGRWRARA